MDGGERDSDVVVFCRQVRARSGELQQAMELVFPHGLTSVAVGLLRQELDSLVRVLFLVTERDRNTRAHLISAAVAGERWRLPTASGRSAYMTDRALVEVAEQEHPGWVNLVYGFGCSFIHLSALHDYQCRDPFRALPEEERRVIVRHLNHYHGGELSIRSTFGDVTMYVPQVLTKISTNLSIYVDMLERGEELRQQLITG